MTTEVCVEMSFLQSIKNKINALLKKQSLSIPDHPIHNFVRRISPRTLCASLSLEASIVVPLFLFFCLTLCSLLEQYRSYSMMSYAVQQVGNTISVNNHILLSGQIEGQIRELAGDKAKESDVSNLLYLGGKVSFDLSYREETLINIWGVKKQERRVRFYGHQWVGYELQLTDVRDGEEYVFVTTNSEVYHRSRDCTHLKLSISSMPASTVPSSYRSCERCHAVLSGMVYVTAQGDCYHSSVECSGLKRSVRAIPLSEAVMYRPCSRCGGGQ